MYEGEVVPFVSLYDMQREYQGSRVRALALWPTKAKTSTTNSLNLMNVNNKHSDSLTTTATSPTTLRTQTLLRLKSSGSTNLFAPGSHH